MTALLIELVLIGLVIYLLYAHQKLKKEFFALQRNQKTLFETLEHHRSGAVDGSPAPAQQSFYSQGPAANQEAPVVQAPPVVPEPTVKPMPVYAPVADSGAAAPTDDAPSAKSLENWVGRNLIGVIASVLIFIGLTFFGLLVYVMAGDLIKVTLMYTFSAALTLVGVWLNRRRPNTFTQLLTGCGCGAFFISVLLTHLVFGYLSFVGALFVLLVWIFLTLCLSKAVNSAVISAIAHLGMIISVCYAYTLGFSADHLPYLVIYQFAAAGLTLAGSIFFQRKTYLLGLFSALALNLFANVSMLRYFAPTFSVATVWFFIPQLVAASVLSFVISGALRRERFAPSDHPVWGNDLDSVRLILHLASKLIWIYALFIVIDNVLKQYVFSFVALLVLLCHIGISVLLGAKNRLDAAQERISVVICSAGIAKYLLIIWFTPLPNGGVFPVPLLALLSLLLLGIDRHRASRAYTIAAYAALAADLLLMLLGGYGRLVDVGTAALAFVYLALYPAILLFHWWMQAPARRDGLVVPYRIAAYALIHLSVTAILFASAVTNPALISAILLTVLNTALLIAERSGAIGNHTPLWPRFTSIAVQLLLLANLGVIARHSLSRIAATGVLVPVIVLSVLSIALCVFKLYLSAREEQDARLFFELAGSVTLTLLILELIHVTTSLFSDAYVLSLVCMVTALCFIIAGFWTSSKAFRLYGLVLTLICVLKLVTYDVSTQNTILRVAALIGGGIICFIISGIYNYSVKRLGTGGDAAAKDSDEADV